MGESAFKWLGNNLAFTVLPLERLLNNLPDALPDVMIDTLKKYFNHNQKNFTSLEDFKLWQNIISNIGIQTEIAKLTNKTFNGDDLTILFDQNLSLNDLSDNLNKILIEALFESMNLPEEQLKKINYNNILQKIPGSQFTLLVISKMEMTTNHPFAPMLDELLNLYLTDQDVNRFLHEPNQTSKVGCEIARHNLVIREKLQKAGIDPKMALEYPKKHNFYLTSTQSTQQEIINRQLENLVNYLPPLLEILQNKREVIESLEDEKAKMQFASITKQAIQVKNIPVNKLLEQQNWGLLEKIYANITVLLQNPNINSEGEYKQFHEFGLHFKDLFDELKKMKNETQAPQKLLKSVKKQEEFMIEQWDKRRIQTLFLGNEVDCCLAAGSPQFPAIVQRIIDDAMLFHVVTNKETGKPVALSWLYLAEDKSGDIYIVANFVEIKGKYGANEEARKKIIDELLSFTGNRYFGDNPKFKGFLINDLKYGWNKKKLSQFPTEIVPLVDKLGGALLPGVPAEQKAKIGATETCKVYYLASLDRSELLFHKYPTPTPSQSHHFFSNRNVEQAETLRPEKKL